MQHILVIDDDQYICELLRQFLKKKGFEVAIVETGKKAELWLKNNKTDLVLCDFKLPDYTGLDMLSKIKILDNNLPVIIITGYSDVRVAVEALKKGAYEYVTKPINHEEILLNIQNALIDRARSEKEDKDRTFGNKQYVQGTSHYAQNVQKHIDLIAPTDMSVIILGETGTGKEYVANAIHHKSKRATNPFVAIDCGALPENLAGSELFGHVKGAFTGAVNDKKGSFELANKGTLFLDEIANLSYENQVKLLRVLQEGAIRRIGDTRDIKVDVRVVVATNENLIDAVKRGDFREDIYHRLNEFKIEISPLRYRKEDIDVFAEYFLQQANSQLKKQVKGFDNEVIKVFHDYYWYGNLRELNNVVKRSVLLCQGDLIDIDCLPPELSNHTLSLANQDADDKMKISFPRDLKSVVADAEKKAILQALEHTRYNKSKTAELLGIDRKTLYNKMDLYDINPDGN